MNQLLEVTTAVTEWDMLGMKLGLELPILIGIRVTHHPSGLGTLKMHMFRKWLDKFPRASWDDVIKALKEMNHDTCTAAAVIIENGRHRKIVCNR